jgi:hypothetical protein
MRYHTGELTPSGAAQKATALLDAAGETPADDFDHFQGGVLAALRGIGYALLAVRGEMEATRRAGQ